MLAGTGVAAYVDEAVWWKAALALVVSLALQVGVNYANDYSDGIRGTDDDRVGPMRLVGSGVAAPGAVKRAAFLAFGVAGRRRAGARGDDRLVAGRGRARSCVLAAWFYTGGAQALRLPRPRRGDGVRVLRAGRRGRHDVRADRDVGVAGAVRRRRRSARWPARSWSPTTCATSRPTPIAGKRTLAVRLGDPRTRGLYALLVLAAAAAVVAVAVATTWWVLLGLGLPAHRRPRGCGPCSAGPDGPALVPVLQQTGRPRLALGGAGRRGAVALSGLGDVRRTLDGMTFLIISARDLVAVVAWQMRVQLLAKVLGQSESRIDRQLNRAATDRAPTGSVRVLLGPHLLDLRGGPLGARARRAARTPRAAGASRK